MPNRPEMQRPDMPKMQAPQRSRESEFGDPPKAATKPMRTRRDEAPASKRNDRQKAQGEGAGGTPGPAERAVKDPDTPGSAGRSAEPDSGAGTDAASEPVMAAESSRHGDAQKPSRFARKAKSGRGQRAPKRKPMIQRVDAPADFPEFPDPAGLDVDKPAGREDSPQMVRAIAVGMPILGLIGGGAFTFGLAALGSAGQFPFSFAVGLIAVLCMMAGVTVIALNLLRQSQKVGRETDELLSQYFEPETAAVRTVTTLGEAIRREMGKLSDNLDTLTNRISAIERRLQDQSSDIGHAMDRLEQRAKSTTQTLSDERDRIENTARSLNDKTQSAAQSLDDQIAAARTVIEQVSEQLGEADKSLTDRISALENTAQSTTSSASEASGILEKQAERVAEISQGALDTAKRTTDRYQNQHRMLTEAVDKLSEEAGRLDRVFDTQRQSLREIAEAAAKQSERIEEVLGQCVSGLTTTLDSATAKADSIGAAFTEQSEAILAAGEDAAGAMKRAADSAQSTSKQARQALQKQAEASQQTLDEQLSHARETLGGLTDETAKSVEKQVEASRGALDTVLAGLRDMVESRLQEAREQFDGMIGEFDKTIEEQITALREHRDSDRRDWDAWRDRIGTALEGVRLQARDSLKTLNDTAGEVEDRLSSLPAKLTSETEQMHKTLAEQMQALETLSASVRKSVKSIGSLLTNLPTTMTTSSEELTAKLKGHVEEIEKLTGEARSQVGDLHHMFDRLPRRIDGQAEQIRIILDKQMQKIDQVAALAARRAQEVNELQRKTAVRPDARSSAPLHGGDPRGPVRSGPAPMPRRPKPAAKSAPPADPAAAPRSNMPGTDKNESVPADSAEENQDLSVQEILARRQQKDENGAGTPETAVDGERPPAESETPRTAFRRPGPPRAEETRYERDGTSAPAPRTPPAAPTDDAESAPSAPGSVPPRQDDTGGLDHPADFRRMAKLKEEERARTSAEAPSSRGEEDVSGVPSFLRRPARPEGAGPDKPAEKAPTAGPGADARKRALAGGQAERPSAIFRKRFTDFDETGTSPTPASDKPPVSGDGISIKTGATNVNRPHPAAAARRAMLRDGPGTSAEESGKAGTPGGTDAPKPSFTQDGRPAEKQPSVRETAGDAKAGSPDDLDAPAAPTQESAKPNTPAGKQPEQQAKPSGDFEAPPLPSSLRKAMSRDSHDGKGSGEADAAEKAGRPAGRSGRLGWADILAAADRSSHEEGIPEAETGLDPDQEKARTAVPEGPKLGTPELQAIARDIVSVLQTLSLDLRPVWRETLPPEVIRRFLKGDKRALTRRLPVMGGMEAMTRIRRCYRSDSRFSGNVDRFVQEFDVLVDQIHGLDAARAEKYMSSQNGRLFILLKQVLSKS